MSSFPVVRPGDLICITPGCSMNGQQASASTCPACGLPTSKATGIVPQQPLPSIPPAATGPHAMAMPGPSADIGRRLVARLIDAGIMLVPLACLGGLGYALDSTGGEPNLGLSVIGLTLYVGIFLYEFVMLGISGQTVGKRVMKLKVVKLTGEPIGWGQSAARVYVQSIASACTCGLMGLLFALSPLFDSGPWKRGWPDQIASTVVITTA